MTISPDDFEQGSKILDVVIQLGKWAIGTAAAAWVAVRWTLRQGVRVGEEKQRYEDLQAAVEKINSLDLDSLIRTVVELKTASPDWITLKQHESMQAICQQRIEGMINDKMHRAVLEWKDELAALNANICHIMGALNIRPVDQGKRRRQTDTED